MEQSKLVILVGASCSGKTGLSKKILALDPTFRFVRSRSTRAHRPPPWDVEDAMTYGPRYTPEEYQMMSGELWSDVTYREDRYGLADADFHNVLALGNGIIPLVPEVAEKCYERYCVQYRVRIIVLQPTAPQFMANMDNRKIPGIIQRMKIFAEANAIAARAWRVPVTRLEIWTPDDYQRAAQDILGNESAQPT